MSLLKELLNWAQNDLKPWQSDAVRRLFGGHQLNEADYQQLLLLLKQSGGIAVEHPLEANPLSEEHLPQVTDEVNAVVVQSLGPLKHVNRLAEGQVLNFEPAGVTVIYGDNGSGKSGYSRVVKSACRARVKDEPVLPNAQVHFALHETPEGIFKISRGGTQETVLWQEGKAPPTALSSVAVLDTRCARAYTDAEGDLIFVPWGLDVVESLARVVFPQLETRLRAEINGIDVSSEAFLDLSGMTAVGILLKGLSHDTKLEQVEALTNLTTAETERYGLVEQTLAAENPSERARLLRIDVKRLCGVRERIATRLAVVNEAALTSLRGIHQAATVAASAEKLAAEAMRSEGILLAGSGESAWKAMFEAAQRFLTEHKHDGEFGTVGQPCPICQSPIDTTASQRIKRFVLYLHTDTAKVADARAIELAAAGRLLEQSTVAFDIEPATVDYLSAGQAELAHQLQRLEDSALERKKAMLVGVESGAWEAIPKLALDPCPRIAELATRLSQEADELDKSQVPGHRKTLEKELAELSSRQNLAVRKDALLALLERKKRKYALEMCLSDLRTRPISDKAKTFAKGVVTQALSDALNQEFEKLGVRNLQATLGTRIEEARPKLRLVLNLPGGTKPERVLSEGEQRVIAVGSFLAELKVSGHKGAAVFDDPVSSLDHQRRRRVASRLVAEGKYRQVIIFTHDTVFLAELLEQLEEQKTPSKIHHLNYGDKVAGIVCDGLPWYHQGYADRLDALDKDLRLHEKQEAELDNEQKDAWMRRYYGRLRQVTERATQDLVLGGVLTRYSDYVRLPNLTNVVGLSDEDCAPFILVYRRCGDVIDGHDKAVARAFVAPQTDEARRDLDALRAGIERLKLRRRTKAQNAIA